MKSMDDKSALALLLSYFSGNSNDNSNLANKLYSKFGSFYNVVNADEEKLSLVNGMTEKKLGILKSLPSILESYLKSKLIKNSSEINTYDDVIDYFKLSMRGLKFEVFSYAIFDIKKRVIEVDSIFRGSISSATIYPRELIEIALSKTASYIVVAHNHPSGSIAPSSSDIILTEDLYNICFSVGVALIDHVIIAGDEKYSFREVGLIDSFEESNLNKNSMNGEYYA